MKKIVAVLTLLLTLTISANAQDKKIVPETAAKNDAAAADQKMTLSGTAYQKVYDIMLMKHTALSDTKLTAADKEELYKTVDYKLKKALSKGQYNSLFKNPDLKNQLIH